MKTLEYFLDKISQVSAKAVIMSNNIEKISFAVSCVIKKFAGLILPFSKVLQKTT